MPDVLVPEAIAGPALDELARHHEVVRVPELWRDPDRLRALLPDFRALIVRNQTRVTADLIGAGARLQIIGRAGVGLDNIDVPAASAAGVVVVFAPGDSAVAVAELALGLMLALARHINTADRDTRAGGWNRARFVGVELGGKTLGLVGGGRIARETGLRARAFGMGIVIHDPYLTADHPNVRDLAARLVSLDELCALSDVVSCHVPETPETRGCFDHARFASMKAGALFVNTARGGLVDEAGLARVLADGHLGGAALDVRTIEPPAAGDALAAMDNVILTPHVGAFSREAQAAVVTTVCRDVAAVLRGEPARSFANFPPAKGATP
jgi:D-3-phosphoglycerate dehydrogenase